MKHIGTSVERGQVHNAFFKAPLKDIISHSYLLLPSRSINPGKDKKINVKGNREMFWDLNPEKIIWTPFLQAAFPFLTFTIITLPLNSPFRQSYHLTPVSLPQLSAILLFFFSFLSYRALSRLSSSPGESLLHFPASRSAMQLPVQSSLVLRSQLPAKSVFSRQL